MAARPADSSLPAAFLVLLLLGLTLPGGQACADDGAFRVLSAETRLVDEVYRLDARLALSLSGAAREALENGVPLVLVIQIQVVAERDWLWDSVTASLAQRFRLRYHALSDQFVVRNLNTGVQRAYRGLGDALDSIGTVDDLPMLDRRLLKVGRPYHARLRAALEIESLPTPMRLWAYTSGEWRLASDWYTWPLQP